MAAKRKAAARRRAPSYYKHRKRKGHVKAHERWVAGTTGKRVCTYVPPGHELVLKHKSKIGRRRKKSRRRK